MNGRIDALQPDAPAVPWARSRLRLGQSNVGAWVCVAFAVVWWQPGISAASGVGEAALWAAVVGAYVVLQAPFDVVGGYVLPVRHGRRAPGVAAWLREWSRGVGAHAGVWLLGGWLSLGVARAVGLGWAMWVAPVVALGLLAAQRALLGVSTEVRGGEASAAFDDGVRAVGLEPARVALVDVPADRGFVGGWVGLPGRERLLLPKLWAEDRGLRPVVLARRAHALRSGARSRGVVAAWLWNTVGWLAVLALIPGAGLTSASGLLLASAGFTIWAFVGLLTLPTLSRRAVIDLDQHAAGQLGVDGVAQAIARLDRDQEDEQERPAWQGRIFHPVPTPSARVAALQGAQPGGASLWRVTRTALFLGWAQGSWLSRAVHCNIGRAGVWVLLPGD